MFSVNSYAKIKSVEDKGNYALCKISTSKKDRVSGKYETDFIATARFVGDAYKQRPMTDQRIKITSCGTTNCYVKDDKLEFPKSPTYVVFGYELQDDNGGVSTPNLDMTELEKSELPF